MLGMLERHLHIPAERHEATDKTAFRYLSTRAAQGPHFKGKGPLTIEYWTHTDYAADPDARRSNTGLLLTMSGVPTVWITAGQVTVERSSTE